MYQENAMRLPENGFSQTVPNFTPTFSSIEELSFHQNPQQEASAGMEIEELLHRMGFERNTPLTQEMVPESNLFHLPNSSFSYPDQAQNSPSFLPTLGFLGNVASDTHSALDSNSANFDPRFHLNLPPPLPPLSRGLMFESPMPNGGYNMNTGSLFGGVVDEIEGSCGGYGYDNGVFEFNGGDRSCGGRKSNGKGSNRQLNTEKQRRGQLSDKYEVLRNLVPNPTKADRASVVGDAIGYIKELLRTVNELKMLVERKRCSIERIKRHKTESDGPDHQDQSSYNGLRSSWLQRKFKDSEIDVRIVDDEVTIKFAHPQKKINCLLPVSKALDELQLDIQHVGGGLVVDNYCFLFNSKICEGSSIYASAIANKIIEVVDKQYPTIPTN
ncbi:transcription factor bHLH10-like [Rhododendron vialii]|uniref:transcription factor bHLH10-like n=1 Tax=Rhododendron vialii TaxID=182163 RepID=UPI00265F8936|nr:transcription factor bHLH10-like [Rhododendron vialii]